MAACSALEAIGGVSMWFLVAMACSGSEEAGETDLVASDLAATFFVTSDTQSGGDLGGLAGADARCASLAAAAGLEAPTWAAYLSTAAGPVHARDRIGAGPWTNVAGVTVADDLDALHTRTGDVAVFLDETGARVNGQWAGSPSPNEHDVLTGSNADGTAFPGKTCADWTADDPALVAQVGHTDGLGPGENGDPPFDSWNASHTSGCDDFAPQGGAGKLYCFAP